MPPTSTKEEKLDFFDSHLIEIFNNLSEAESSLFLECLSDKRVLDSIKIWPEEIKLKVVDHHLIQIENNGLEDIGDNSWDEFYEMYDGKFDEKHMLHYKVYTTYKNEIEDLGYIQQVQEDNWHKPQAGEYKIDTDGDLVIIHSCPDREIFEVEASQYLEELSINHEWVCEASLSIM